MKKNALGIAVSSFVIGAVIIAGGQFVDAKQINVAKGDTLSEIAKNNNTTVDQIAKDNNISNINLIYIGQALEVGEGGNGVATAAPAPAAQSKQPTQQQPAQKQTQPRQSASASTGSSTEQQAKEWIAQKESGGNYGAVSATGKYIGRYQLTNSYLNGDYSAANQERVAENYVKSRYGSWSNAKAHHLQTGWY
ncbi:MULTISPECIES: LysM peptidoglycan-binding domain-containing protein [Listeria]|uniref:aggregation-promoting factor n=1 Tax=Listeria TaxID=1637 RepID=UPI000B58EC1D|nr:MULTISPECIES: LysM peptidoglycan-binding domain-containing protein [Listeria]